MSLVGSYDNSKDIATVICETKEESGKHEKTDCGATENRKNNSELQS
jgi:hypothetical protein